MNHYSQPLLELDSPGDSSPEPPVETTHHSHLRRRRVSISFAEPEVAATEGLPTVRLVDLDGIDLPPGIFGSAFVRLCAASGNYRVAALALFDVSILAVSL